VSVRRKRKNTKTVNADNSERTEQVKASRPQIKSALVMSLVAFLIVLSYLGGYYHHQIVATVGPLFGYNAHAGELDLSSVQETYRKLKANFDGDLDDNDLVIGANKGLVEAAGDEYTVYMNAKESENFDNSLSGSIGGGIGAELSLNENEQVIIYRVLKNVPAEEAGLKDGDIIKRVNNQSTDGWSVEDAVEVIRGEVGSTVKLTIERAGKERDFSITRESISVPSVDSELQGNVGILRVSRFDTDTARVARSEVTQLMSGGAKSIILDLRGNSGGYLNAAVELSGLWLNNKEVVSEKRGDRVIKTQKTKNQAILDNVPTVVLVDGGSASASEIVAGALQDHKAAKLVGQKTYGKGSVQTLFNLSNHGKLKVTIAKWYTPLGINISEQGINPDYVVEPTNEKDAALETAKALLRG
jgi:carboxyl-terminal processing protease